MVQLMVVRRRSYQEKTICQSLKRRQAVSAFSTSYMGCGSSGKHNVSVYELLVKEHQRWDVVLEQQCDIV